MYGHPLARQLEKFWQEHCGDNNHDDPEWHQWLTKYQELMTLKMIEFKSEHKNEIDDQKVYGMSKVGGPTRAANLAKLGFKPSIRSGSTNFTFWLGHEVELAALATLEMIGVEIKDTQAKQQIFTEIDDKKIPLFGSTSDGITNFLGLNTVISVKSAAYKMSGKRAGQWYRQGFAELPFEGVRKSHPEYWLQLQAELLASGYPQGMFVFAAKDIVKAFEGDEYLGARGNGSLTFYVELIKPEVELHEMIMKMWTDTYKARSEGKAGDCYYVSKNFQYVKLEKAEVNPKNIWGGKNQEITGRFNPCGGCDFLKVCSEQS